MADEWGLVLGVLSSVTHSKPKPATPPPVAGIAMGCVTGQSAGGTIMSTVALIAVPYRPAWRDGNSPGSELRSKLTSAHSRRPPISWHPSGVRAQCSCKSLHIKGSSEPHPVVPTVPHAKPSVSKPSVPSRQSRWRPPSVRVQHFVWAWSTGSQPAGLVNPPLGKEGATVGVVV